MNLKTTSLFLLAILFSGVAFAQNSFRINGKIDKMPAGSKVTLVNTEIQEGGKIVDADIVNGLFTLKGQYQRPRLCEMRFYTPFKDKKGKMQLGKCGVIRVMLDNSTVTFTSTGKVMTSDSTNFYKESASSLKGGKAQQELNEYLRAIRRQENIAQKVSFAEADAWFANQGSEDAIADLKKKTAEEAQKLQQQKFDFMRSHPDYIVSGQIASAAMTDLFKYTQDELRSMEQCIKNNPDTARVHWVERNMNKILAYARGAHYTDFTGKTKEGADLKLSACMKEGAYTLIDFWASWCGPCRSAIPRVKKMYEKYNGKLVVVSASVDAKEEDWRKAEKEEAMPWQQLLLSKTELQNVAGRAYEISSIPKLVLINPKGEILLVTHDPQLISSVLAKQI